MDHNGAMDRRLRKYHFKSLPRVVPEASKWLSKHAMDIIVWEQNIAGNSPCRADPISVMHESGLPEDELRNILKVSLVDEQVTESSDADVTQDGSDQDETDDSDDESIMALTTALDQSLPRSLRHRHRHLSNILDSRRQEKQRLKKQEEWCYQQRKEGLISRVVSSDHAALLPRDDAEPLPMPIRDDLVAIQHQKRQDQLEANKRRAKDVLHYHGFKTLKGSLVNA